MTSQRTALVTGASSGLGAALARELAAGGAEVVLLARRASELEAVAAQIRAAGGRARPIAVDVTHTEALLATVRRVDRELGGLDLVIANAGLGAPVPARELDWEAAAPVLATNFTAAIATLTAVLPEMIGRGRGHLVGISSVAVHSPLPAASLYRATKCGLTAFLENLHAELGGTGVAATVVHPGFVRTPLADAFAIDPPFVLSSEEAARRIVRGLRRAPVRIDFPWPVVLVMRAVGALPRAVRDPWIRRTELRRLPTGPRDRGA